MKIKRILPLILLVLMINSCGSKIGVGLSRDSGSMLLKSDEGSKSGVGGYLEYGYQKMFDRHGVGVDFNFNFKGYVSDCVECYEGTDMLYHTFQVKYYYTLMERGAYPFQMNLALGLGTSKFTLNSRDRYYPTVFNAGLEFYFTENELFYLSTRARYMNHLKGDEYNLGMELGIGFYFRGYDNY